MRSLVLETFTAAIQLSSELLAKGILEVDLEGTAGYVRARIEDLVPVTVTPQEKKILEELEKTPQTLADLKSRLEIPKTTLWKTLRKLEEKQLIEKEYIGKTIVYKTTKKALQYTTPTS